MEIIKQILPQVILLIFVIDRLIFRITAKLNGRWKHIGFRYSWKDYLFGVLATHFILLMGGFYDKLGAPQVIAVMVGLFLIGRETMFDGRKKYDNFNITYTILNFIILLVILFWGGFFDGFLDLFCNFF